VNGLLGRVHGSISWVNDLLGRKDVKQPQVPKGIALSADELVAHVHALRSQAMIDSDKKDKPHLSGSSCYKEAEVVLFNEQKSSVYVFDGSSPEDTYVILEVRGCEKGPLLLPPANADDGGSRWSPPEDRYLHLAAYLVVCMQRLSGRGEDWSDRISMSLNGEILVRYQAAVREKDWRQLWDGLIKPFGAQRTAYRGVYRTTKAPDLFFGVNAKYSVRKSESVRVATPPESIANPPESTTDNSSERDTGNAPTSTSLSSDGIPLPTAADWLEFWHEHEIPIRRTFIEFASDFGEVAVPPRSNSSPDLLAGGVLPDQRFFSL
jgi:hypothetical protein